MGASTFRRGGWRSSTRDPPPRLDGNASNSTIKANEIFSQRLASWKVAQNARPTSSRERSQAIARERPLIPDGGAQRHGPGTEPGGLIGRFFSVAGRFTLAGSGGERKSASNSTNEANHWRPQSAGRQWFKAIRRQVATRERSQLAEPTSDQAEAARRGTSRPTPGFCSSSDGPSSWYSASVLTFQVSYRPCPRMFRAASRAVIME